jgi:chromosome segregation ATPase
MDEPTIAQLIDRLDSVYSFDRIERERIKGHIFNLERKLEGINQHAENLERSVAAVRVELGAARAGEKAAIERETATRMAFYELEETADELKVHRLRANEMIERLKADNRGLTVNLSIANAHYENKSSEYNALRADCKAVRGELEGTERALQAALYNITVLSLVGSLLADEKTK